MNVHSLMQYFPAWLDARERLCTEDYSPEVTWDVKLMLRLKAIQEMYDLEHMMEVLNAKA
jgi:hypothetical protein